MDIIAFHHVRSSICERRHHLTKQIKIGLLHKLCFPCISFHLLSPAFLFPFCNTVYEVNQSLLSLLFLRNAAVYIVLHPVRTLSRHLRAPQNTADTVCLSHHSVLLHLYMINYSVCRVLLSNLQENHKFFD